MSGATWNCLLPVAASCLGAWIKTMFRCGLLSVSRCDAWLRLLTFRRRFCVLMIVNWMRLFVALNWTVLIQ